MLLSPHISDSFSLDLTPNITGKTLASAVLCAEEGKQKKDGEGRRGGLARKTWKQYRVEKENRWRSRIKAKEKKREMLVSTSLAQINIRWHTWLIISLGSINAAVFRRGCVCVCVRVMYYSVCLRGHWLFTCTQANGHSGTHDQDC